MVHAQVSVTQLNMYILTFFSFYFFFVLLSFLLKHIWSTNGLV